MIFFFLYLLTFRYQLPKASNSYTHVGVTSCHVSESYEAETCLARMRAALLQFLLTKEKENSWKAKSEIIDLSKDKIHDGALGLQLVP